MLRDLIPMGIALLAAVSLGSATMKIVLIVLAFGIAGLGLGALVMDTILHERPYYTQPLWFE